MSRPGRPEDEALDRLSEIRDAEVPDPGPAYWQSFPGRVRVRAEAGRRRAGRRALAALAAAAAVLALMWVGAGRLSGDPDPPMGSAAEAVDLAGSGPSAGTGSRAGGGQGDWDADSVDGALELVLGPEGTGYPAGAEDLASLSEDQKQALLASLRAELES